MKKVKKICSWLVIICVLMSFMPQVMVQAADASWFDVEVETGTLTRADGSSGVDVVRFVPIGWYGGDARGTITATATKSGLSATAKAVDTVVYGVRAIEYSGLTFDSTFAAGSNITAKFTGVKAATSEESLTAIAVIAVYKDGNIESIKLSGEKTITTTAQDITAKATLPADMENVTVRGYLWTGLDTMIPIANVLAYGSDYAGYDEDLFDIMTIDRENRKIYATRFGAGQDREFSY